jgi:hypothetical protein
LKVIHALALFEGHAGSAVVAEGVPGEVEGEFGPLVIGQTGDLDMIVVLRG